MIEASVGFTLESRNIYSLDVNTAKCFSDVDGYPTYEGLTGAHTHKSKFLGQSPGG